STFSLFNELSDLVVANSSQNAGFFSNNNFHTSNQCHLGSTDNPFNISRCKQLLCEGPKSAYFSQDGFHPVNLSYPNKENETDNNSLVVNGNVTITSPQNGTTFHPGDVVSINITGSSNIAKLTVGVGNNSIPLYADFQMSNSGSFLYTIPNVAFGGIKIIAVGIDNGGNFVDLDTLGIQVNTLATLDSLSIYPGLIFAPINGQFKFSLYGYYSDGIKRDLSYLPTLQSYIANNNIASFLNPCIIKGLKVDSTELQITFSGKSIQVPIIVYKGDDAFSIPDPISQNQTDNSAIKIFPNPSSGIFKIEYNTKVGQVITTSIYNQFGQKIYCQKEKVFTDLFLKEINLNTIPAGIYNITIATESKQSSNKFVIIK
ncbi:MAG: T9SS type A sorting domain-containing protein, partial [Bacteroidota bacterium]